MIDIFALGRIAVVRAWKRASPGRWLFFILFPILVLILVLFVPQVGSAQLTSAGGMPAAGVVVGEKPLTPSRESAEPHDALSGRGEASERGSIEAAAHLNRVPNPLWTLPFVALLLCIAILPLIPRTAGWWHHNSSKLMVAAGLGALTLVYYLLRGYGFHHAAAGVPTVLTILEHAIVVDYIPFIVLLFSLFTISGGIYISADVPAHPLTNMAVIFIGASLASFIGTTGASMLLIRPLLQLNAQRRHVAHTVVFFIFLVSNVGGLLLPIGDPPLFLGYLRGVPFLWTLQLLPEWALTVALVLAIYWVFDHVMYRRERSSDVAADEAARGGFEFRGIRNVPLLVGVIFAVAFLVPGKEVPLVGWTVPEAGLLSHTREFVQLALVAVALGVTPKEIRERNAFSFFAIAEVAALFIGIFITMQVPIEILNARGAALGLTSPMEFFWATGTLSSFLDNAPTYVVFFQTAGSLPAGGGQMVQGVATATGSIPESLLAAVSMGSVLMGAMTYIGNGPNFMVKAIAEAYGIRMPSFFGYIAYSTLVLAPVYLIITLIFL